jgi:hypothetical protein
MTRRSSALRLLNLARGFHLLGRTGTCHAKTVKMQEIKARKAAKIAA